MIISLIILGLAVSVPYTLLQDKGKQLERLAQMQSLAFISDMFNGRDALLAIEKKASEQDRRDAMMTAMLCLERAGERLDVLDDIRNVPNYSHLRDIIHTSTLSLSNMILSGDETELQIIVERITKIADSIPPNDSSPERLYQALEQLDL